VREIRGEKQGRHRPQRGTLQYLHSCEARGERARLRLLALPSCGAGPTISQIPAAAARKVRRVCIGWSDTKGGGRDRGWAGLPQIPQQL